MRDEENLADPDGIGIGKLIGVDDSVDRYLIFSGDGGETLPGFDNVFVALGVAAASPVGTD